MSFGGDFCYALYVAGLYAVAADATLVASAGNSFAEGNPEQYPASNPHVVTVGATDPQDRSADFSEENPGIDLAAPGVSVLTAVPPAFDDDGTRDGYESVDGTSFSAPIAAGAAAWVRARRPSLDQGQVHALLDGTAEDLGRAGWDQSFGYGMVDVRSALRGPTPARDPGEPNDDVEWVDGTRFTRADPYVWKGSRSRSFRATVDQWEDPVDVYRIRVPARRRVGIRLGVRYGDPDLVVYSRAAKSLFRAHGRLSRAHRLGLSEKPGRATDRLVVTNRSRKAAIRYVAVL